MSTRITEQSFIALGDGGFTVWQEEGGFYTEESLIPEGSKSLIEEQPYWLVWDYVVTAEDKYLWPGDNPFDILGLHPKYYYTFGLRVKTIYFSDVELTNSVVKIDYVFNKDEGKATMRDRVTKISFKLSDGSWGEQTKEYTKIYATNLAKQREIQARRNNILDQLKSIADDLGISDYIEDLYTRYNTETFQYIKSGSPVLANAIQNSDLAWLEGDLPNGYPARATILAYIAEGM